MILLDTHVLVWWVDGDIKKLSRTARQVLERHGKRNELLLSSISFFEIATLECRGRLQFNIPASMAGTRAAAPRIYDRAYYG